MKYLILPLALGITLFACSPKAKKDDSQENSSKEAAFPLSNLDTTVSPCEDFYQYAIGGWLANNPVPSTESRWSSFNVVRDSNNAKLKKILIEFSTGNFEKGSMEQKIGDFYKSAMDSTKAEELGITPIQQELSKIDNISTVDDLINLCGYFSTIGVGSMYGLYVGQDDKNSAQYITHLYQSGLGLPDRDYYLKDDEKSVEIQQAYLLHIEKMFSLSGIDNPKARALLHWRSFKQSLL